MIPIRDSNPSGTAPIVTVALIAANVIAFLHQVSLGPDVHEFVLRWGLVPGIVSGAYIVPGWTPLDTAMRFVSSIFLHGGWLHLIGNMWYLWIFGDNIEDRFGHVGFLAFYLICGVVASMVHVLANVDSLIPTVGASGAIAGVLGAYLICFPGARITMLVPVFFLPLFIQFPAVIVLGIWFLTQLSYGSLSLDPALAESGGVAWWAHVGGFVVGMILVRYIPPRKKRRQHVYHPSFDR